MDRRKCIKKMTTVVNLHTEPLLCMPFIEIAGNRRVLIERHLGVMEYDESMIRVKVKNGCVCISGRCLELTQMSRYTLVIYGEIHGLTIQTQG